MGDNEGRHSSPAQNFSTGILMSYRPRLSEIETLCGDGGACCKLFHEIRNLKEEHCAEYATLYTSMVPSFGTSAHGFTLEAADGQDAPGHVRGSMSSMR